MTRTKKFLAAAIVAGIGLFGPSVGHADEMLEPTPGADITTPALGGTNSGGTMFFTTTVESAYCGPGLAPTDYTNALGLGSSDTTSSGIYVYAYIVNNIGPSNDPPHALQVMTGSDTIKTGEFSAGGSTVSNTGAAGYTGGVPANVVPAGANVIFNFGGLNPLDGLPSGPTDPYQSPVLLFATLGTPVLQSAFVTDAGASTLPSLVISDAGTNFAGTPLPTPASAWGGLCLLGLLAGAKLRKARA